MTEAALHAGGDLQAADSQLGTMAELGFLLHGEDRRSARDSYDAVEGFSAESFPARDAPSGVGGVRTAWPANSAMGKVK